MFNQLISLIRPTNNKGIIWSVQGGHYIAQHIDPKNNIIKQAPENFKSLSLAKYWLNKQGVHRVFLRQSPVYFEMIGLSA